MLKKLFEMKLTVILAPFKLGLKLILSLRTLWKMWAERSARKRKDKK